MNKNRDHATALTENTTAEYNMYNPMNIKARRAVYDVFVKDTAEHILIGNTIADALDKRLMVVRRDSLDLRSNLDITIPETAVPESKFKIAIEDFDELTRKKLWGYRRAAIRAALLSTLVSTKVNKKKLGFRLNASMEAIVDIVLSVGSNDVTLSQIIHRVSPVIGVEQYVTKEGNVRPSNAWLNDELALQLVSELAELDYLDITIKAKTHMVRLNDKVLKGLDHTKLGEMSATAKFLSMSTVLTEKATIPKNLISRSSWWYDTPDLSLDQIEFVEAMNDIKYGFVEDAETKIEEAFKTHLKVDTLDQSSKTRVKEFQRQIRVSHANGGHYVSGKFDSSLRWYYGSEIGQVQTSKELRRLVTFDGIKDPVKWDFRNNVVQMYSILTGIRSLGHYVGLTDAEEQLGDLRTLIAQRLNTELGVTSFNKDNVKPLFMIWAYNAGQKRLMSGVLRTETNFFTGKDMVVQKVDGLGKLAGDSTDQVWEVWNNILNELVPGIVAIKMVFKKLFKANPIEEISWTTPDNSVAQYASVVTNSEPLHWIDSKYKMHTHTHYRKEIVAGEKNTGGLPRIIHSFDAYVMRQLVIRAKRLGIVIVPNHDSFIFDREHETTVFGLVDTILNELRESSALDDVVRELNVKKADLTLLDSEGKTVTVSTFGGVLSFDDIKAGTPLAPEDM